MSEKREHSRHPIENDVAFQVGDGPRTTACCRDVSLGGMFIETAAALPYGSAVRVHLRLPGLRDEVVIESIVRWSHAGGMGVQFGRMGARDTHALTLLLAAS